MLPVKRFGPLSWIQVTVISNVLKGLMISLKTNAGEIQHTTYLKLYQVCQIFFLHIKRYYFHFKILKQILRSLERCPIFVFVLFFFIFRRCGRQQKQQQQQKHVFVFAMQQLR